MDTLLTRSYFVKIFTFFIISSSILTQPLYEDDTWSFNDFNTKSKEVLAQPFLQKLEIRLKETESQFYKCKEREHFMSESYIRLLEMIKKGQFPDDETIDTICVSQPNLIIKSRTECHRYYNCSGKDPYLVQWKPIYNYWPALYKHECHYPNLFSEETLQCEHYTKVTCGSRYEAPWECDYFRPRCKLAHCKPCSFEYPSCKHKPDGVWPWPSNPYYPDYMKCEKGRRIEKGYCPVNSEWGVQSFPYNGKCVQLFAVPKEYNPNGELSSCRGKQDGVYQYLVGYCGGFYLCSNGEAFAVKCPHNTIFDTASKTCRFNGKCIY